MRLPPKLKSNEALETSVDDLVHQKNETSVRVRKVHPINELTLQIHKEQLGLIDCRQLQPPRSPEASNVRGQMHGGKPPPSPHKDSQINPRTALGSPHPVTTVAGTPLASPKAVPPKSDTSLLSSKLMPTISGTPLASPKRLKVITRTPLTSPKKLYPQPCGVLHAKDICPVLYAQEKQLEAVSCYVELLTAYGAERSDGSTLSLSPKVEPDLQENRKVELLNEKPVKPDVDCEKGEKVCRVCHMPLSYNKEQGEGVDLGCACKNDLALAHRRCAETWFRIRGNRTCEICGAAVQNICTTTQNSGFLSRWKERRIVHPNPVETRWWNRQPLCNLLLTFTVVAFLLPWLFRVNIFS
ncbi:hypothetical protein O6H91_20G053400 [Diphasiastrum complanatum]|uniref:Uncharacterized protein n=1 Tax=Diphasiastrum complanatum TaxID=34168 RepID=A0ACC2AQE1_DIPCM|nr:hypothetical protein O6H91_20G053400 [Diphasiastrum complanatum]